MRRGLGRAVFNSNNSGNPYYLYNCIVDDIWTTTAKTARRAVFAARGYANVYSSCFRDDVVSGTPAWKDLDFASEIDLVGNLRFHRAGVDEEGHPLCRIDMGCYENDPPGLMLMLK